jgi:23S rRNA (cytidine1920-2'-O)/16S rRNA (cytidine1409-2'-O)-methyltransferase
VLPARGAAAEAGGHLLMLVKPQFELQPGQVGKGGIVRDEALYPQVEKRLRDAATALGLRCAAGSTARSPAATATASSSLHAVRACGPARRREPRRRHGQTRRVRSSAQL